MQDRMIEDMNLDLFLTREALERKKDHAKLRDAVESEQRRKVAGNKRYTPPKRRG